MALWWSVIAFLSVKLLLTKGFADNMSCAGVHSFFNTSDLYGTIPISGSVSPVCNIIPTCCTPAMEVEFMSQSKYKFNSSLANKLTAFQQTLANVTNRFDVKFLQLLNDTKVDLHRMFVKNYGLLYQQNSQIFFDMFRAFRDFYMTGSVDLSSSLADFFASLFQRIFVLLNAQHSFDDEYQECIAENTERIRPFGNIPKEMTSRIEKSFIATRAFSRGLATGRDVLTELVTKIDFLSYPSNCWSNMTQLFYCHYCQGTASMKACYDSCTNVVTSCLRNQWELGLSMSSYIDELVKLAEKLDGSYNIENVVQPIELKLYEAMENFQSNLNTVSAKVVELCGPLSFDTRQKRHLLSVRSASSGGAVESLQSVKVVNNGSRSSARNTAVVGNITLTELVLEIKNQLTVLRLTWCHMPRNMCAELTELPSGDCWNGVTTESPSLNGIETRCFYNNPTDSQVLNSSSVSHKLILQLQSMALKMRSSHSTPINDDDSEVSGDGLDENEYSGSGDDDSVHHASQTSPHTSPYESLRSTVIPTRTTNLSCPSCRVTYLLIVFVISSMIFL